MHALRRGYRLDRTSKGARAIDSALGTLDPITFEVIRSGLVLATEEMKQLCVRTAISPLWKAAGDISCGILSPDGQLVAQGPDDIPIHLGSMPMSLGGILSALDSNTFQEGDAFLHNDPYQGNNHLPDTIMAKPVFHDGQIVGYAAVRGHYIDIGGLRPGSYSTLARDTYGEGLRIPPVRLYKQGQEDPDLFRLIAVNTRMPRDLLGDIRAQYAGCLAGERRVLALVNRYGPGVFAAGVLATLSHAERLMRARISELTPGVYEFYDACDDDGFGDEPINIHVKLQIEGSDIYIDFDGTSRQVPTYMNAPLAVTVSSAYFATIAFLEPETQPNSGAYRPIHVSAPEGCVVNPMEPAPVAAGNHETATRIFDTVLGALAQVDPSRAVAAGSGSSCGFHITGYGNDEHGAAIEPRTWIEVHGAARGAGVEYDGANALHGGIDNTANTPVEQIEMEYPIRIHNYRFAIDSGGPGRWRGGVAVTRDLELLADGAFLTVLSERARIPPYGLFGGMPGQRAQFDLWNHPVGDELRYPEDRDAVTETLRDAQPTRIRAKMDALEVRRGMVLRIRAPGGGGFGSPLERDPHLVARDVTDGYISLESALADYGVVVRRSADFERHGRFVVDNNATDEHRRSVKTAD